MPLPKLPTRPAAILTFPTGEAARPASPAAKSAAVEPATLQPELAGITPVRAAAPARQPAARKAASGKKGANPAALVPSTVPAALKPVTDTAPVALQPSAASAVPTPIAKASTRSERKSRTRAANAARKLFVLDTNVLLHDPTSIFRFEEHDIFLPMMTLEELDHQKKGMSEVARNARQVSRSLDQLVATATDQLDQGVALSALGNKDASGRLLFQTTAIHSTLPSDLPMGKADNQILGVVRALQEKYTDREVALVSKDINMRLKARALGMAAEDYFNDHVLEDSDLLYTGVMMLPEDFWNKHGKDVESWQQSGTTFYRVHGPLCAQFVVNQFVYFEGQMPLYAQVREVNGKTAVLATLRDYTHGKNNVWGITARNREQNFAMNLLMNPDIDFISLLGQAGTGKTLLALAAGLTQVLETKRYTEIIMTRVTVPVGEDIGFLPGTEEEKMLPWMGALEDNLDVLNMGDGEGNNDWGRAATMDLIRSRIKVKSLNFMRGRTFLNKYLIIDEAQNLTPKQMKTLVTRAGPGTKVICLGNIAQIDTPYLTEGSSGLTFVVDRFKGWPHSGHVTLQRGERSRLADYAGDVL
ncbi:MULTISPECIES: PhoH family protein [unclassified Achromobacter]|uniref:PhoH family protein n=1 Tax=unclassified Achromobacter TaxID=2626865 RepID=UPI000B51CFD1|nr:MULTISPECIES: PhoH family protein [unclassified Achromobacter]OWT70157.1 ribonuclease [Achromobacter sp. HZ34]OWT71696.1 ribonuclease [Achromobacter sp. HZ28]